MPFHGFEKSKSFHHYKKLFEIKHHQPRSSSGLEGSDGENMSSPNSSIGSPIQYSNDDKPPVLRSIFVASSPRRHLSDEELMKERFGKLLLGEDMSGGGKGVSPALALSNAITNHAAAVFGEQSKLEPMSSERKVQWRKEIGWFLSVTDHIVEFVPSQQKSNDGSNLEIMVTRQRNDLHMNIPALRKLDAMLIDYLDNFRDQKEFYYGSKDEQSKEGNQRYDDKWWLPTVKVPPEGLTAMSRKWLQFQKESVNQVLKAAMAINAQVLSEMEIPESYIESLPKNGKTSLGDSIYKSITVEYFNPEDFLSTMDLSTEHKVLDLKNKIEASIVIWKRKMHKDGKSSWGSAVSLEKRELFEERAETILLLLKQQFPGLPQSALDISKIQFNIDVGQSVLESYSRIIESLAYTVMSRIEDVLYADSLAKNPLMAESKPFTGPARFHEEEGERLTPSLSKHSSLNTPAFTTLLDCMGGMDWESVPKEDEMKKRSMGDETLLNEKDVSKHNKILTNLKASYIDKLEHWGGPRSPTARH